MHRLLGASSRAAARGAAARAAAAPPPRPRLPPLGGAAAGAPARLASLPRREWASAAARAAAAAGNADFGLESGSGSSGDEELGEGEELLEFDLPEQCAGCGVRLQQEEEDAPGFFQVPRRLLERLAGGAEYRLEGDDAFSAGGAGAGADADWAPAAPETAEEEDAWARGGAAPAASAAEESGADPNAWITVPDGPGGEGGFAAELADGDADDFWAELRGDADADEDASGDEDGAALAPRRRGRAPPRAEESAEAALGGVLCARCFSLRHYGRPASAAAEAAMPGFDLGASVGRRLALQKFRRAVVLAVVDLADFDGSLPRAALRALAPRVSAGRLPRDFRFVIAATKADLLPPAATAKRVEAWVRRRAAQGGLPRPAAVHIVSAGSGGAGGGGGACGGGGAGVRRLLVELREAAGQRGDVYVVGAQNAGKSSLVNALRAAAGLPRSRDVTAAPLPGTTLGVVLVPGLLRRGAALLDTPGVPHPYQLHSLLSADEARLLVPRRRLRPRTFRLGPGQSVALGGVGRVDVIACPGATMYLTVWAADALVTHLGRTESADALRARHAGGALIPPLRPAAAAGADGDEANAAAAAADADAWAPLLLVPTDVAAAGESWRESSTDVAIAGLGWVGVAVDGAAQLRVWAPRGAAVTTRGALLPDLAKALERPGFGAAPAAAPPAGGRPKGGGKGGGKRGAKGGARFKAEA
jgi:ribosome biogenesis GTPase A